MEGNGGRGFCRGRNIGGSRGKRGKGRSNSTMGASPSTGQPIQPSPFRSPLPSTTESPGSSSIPSTLHRSVGTTSSHDPLVPPLDTSSCDSDGRALISPGLDNT